MKTAGNILEDERNAQLRESRTDKHWGGDPLNTSANASNVKSTGLSFPLPLLRWMVYVLLFSVLLLPFVAPLQTAKDIWCWVTGSMIFAHFSGQLNSLRNDKK